jgi:hypothetical protein
MRYGPGDLIGWLVALVIVIVLVIVLLKLANGL